ncbi:two-component system, OmpR family, sensor histidine kinase MprB [Rhodococcus erythropolis]|uniref:histidine kinase n=6 Tax=Rhodococcus erythropolis group TaxID=2840174 RepID=A0A401NA85_RHOER|nr:histidine kinase [Rhodococcus erythropolis R138]EEN83843.1 ATPase/histidine kinase/DNA gyrase B/HSP90 domain protein [Rhodococcus erythropolis SK121]EME24711.1 two-component histidine kinase MprB [Rhodococcus qingshengii BKS 20-40]EQM34732.1 ATP-binding protein [Rhodococcus erythropolis DN1]KDQ04163.1 histidine kinase [Rhodococcus qingshengii]MBF7732368.1 HAMP domain-containing histidine kinase [Rhodococcus erythropolis]MBP2524413.1 two-component system sensor histidine kinase MprB [Rhodoc
MITAPFGKNAEPKKSSTTQASVEMRPPMPLTRSVSLRWRVTLLAASVVAIAVAVMAIAAYAVVSRALYADVDHQLRTRAAVLIDSNVVRFDPRYISGATLYTTDISVALIFSDLSTYQPPGSDVPIGEAEDAVARGESDSSLRTVDGQRVLAQRTHDGSTLVIGQRLAPTVAVLDRLAWVLFVVGGCGVILAAVAGTTVGRTGLRPIARLTAATERVARTDDLTQIPVTGSDELARLTESFNTMLRALAESRERQSRLVADAGHELRTPLTSLRTNMELLIASSRPGAPQIPDEDMAELRADVVAQIEELSTLVGDLVDLAREDAPETVYERVDVSDVVERALERARRRRNEIEFEAVTTPWYVYGDQAGLSRAVLNVLDNAAKWSPKGEQVRVEMRPVGQGLLELTVSDAGPGIPEEDRELVFDRFYRSTAARSMPGSGLGLAIVRQVVVKHGGTIAIDESDRGGALVRIVLPGEPGPSAE